MTVAKDFSERGWHAVVIDAGDNIAVALADLAGAARVKHGAREFVVDLVDVVPAGHKLAIRPIAAGEPVLKYGQAIGTASADIAAGAHVHVHNVKSSRATGRLQPG
jgi:altronate dehydratase